MLKQIQGNFGAYAYHNFGEGSSLMVCLHGYGEEGSTYAYLSSYLGVKYEMICPDLPFHGLTKWNKKDFDTDDLYAFLNTIIPLSLRKITLVGFSMGGRMALAFAQKFPDCVEKLVLIAPDGLHRNFWYRLSTQTSWGNKLFAYTADKPQWIFNMMNVFSRLRLLNASIYKIAHYYLDDEKARKELYTRWTAFRKIKPDRHMLKQEKRFRTLMIFGKYDRIILPDIALQLSKANECIDVRVVHAGHQLLAEKHSRRIAELILQES